MLKLLGGRDCKEVQSQHFNVWRAVQFPMPASWASQLSEPFRQSFRQSVIQKVMDSDNKNHILSGSDCNFIGKYLLPERLRMVSDFSPPMPANRARSAI